MSGVDSGATASGGDRTIGGGHALALGVASAYSAAVAYVVLLIAAHRLSPGDDALFLAFWAILFGGFGIVTGVYPESARAVHDGARSGDTRAARIIPTALFCGGAVALVGATTAPWWGRAVLGGSWWLVLPAAAACFAYAGHLSLLGVLTGLRRWRGTVVLTAGEATLRLVAVLVVVGLVGADLTTLALASCVSAGLWAVLLVRPAVVRHLGRRADLRRAALVRSFGSASLASTASAALTVGFPVLVALTATEAEFRGSAALLLGITLTRAPLLVPLTAYQGVALSHFIGNRHRGWRALLPIVAGILGVAVVGAVAAWAVGPWLFRTVLGGAYELSGVVLGSMTLAAGLLAAQTITGVCCLALGRPRPFAAGWVLSTAAAVGLLLGPGDLTARVVGALLVAPLVGAAVHVGSLVRGSVQDPGGQVADSRRRANDQ